MYYICVVHIHTYTEKSTRYVSFFFLLLSVILCFYSVCASERAQYLFSLLSPLSSLKFSFPFSRGMSLAASARTDTAKFLFVFPSICSFYRGDDKSAGIKATVLQSIGSNHFRETFLLPLTLEVLLTHGRASYTSWIFVFFFLLSRRPTTRWNSRTSFRSNVRSKWFAGTGRAMTRHNFSLRKTRSTFSSAPLCPPRACQEILAT